MTGFDAVLSLDYRCTSQIAINIALGKSEASPFSWVQNYNFGHVLSVLRSDFDGYPRFDPIIPEAEDPLTTLCSYLTTHYKDDDRTRQSFGRKIRRFRDRLATASELLFVVSDEDWVFKDSYRRGRATQVANLLAIDAHLASRCNARYTIVFLTPEPADLPPSFVSLPVSTGKGKPTRRRFREACGKRLKEWWDSSGHSLASHSRTAAHTESTS